MPLDRTPLFEEHRRLGARLIDFAGWEMPVQYAGIIAEHRAVRAFSGVFDVSHMGRLLITGDKAADLLQSLLTNDVALLTPGSAQYTLLCRENGGILDDLVLFRLEHDRFLLVTNAVNRQRDFTWVEEHACSDGESKVEDTTRATTMIALQGQEAATILQTLIDRPLDTLRRFACAEGSVAGRPCLIARTGYTGEDGFELVTSANDGPAVWRALLGKGAQPCGLGARDTLRLEAAYPLYGNDLDESTNPIEAGLGWVVDMVKGDFVGRAAIELVLREGPARKLVGLELLGPGIARSGYPIYLGDQEVGRVTSGSHSPTLAKSIALGYVPVDLAKIGTQLRVVAREKPIAAVVSRKPFYRSPSLKST